VSTEPGTGQKPIWVGEIKWSNRIEKSEYDDTKSMRHMLKYHNSIKDGFLTTRTYEAKINLEGRDIDVVPTAIYCYTVGRNITASLEIGGVPKPNESAEVQAAE
jgi:hypothetical protein